MFIVFDIGGTKTRLARSDDGETFGEPIMISTPKDFEEGVAAFKAAVDELSDGVCPEAMAGGIRGPLNKEKTGIVSDIVLTDWVGKDVAGALTTACGAPVYLENDTAMVGLGEATVGPGKGQDIVAYITVSTGVGGVRIVGGEIDESAMGFEPGKQIIDPDNSLCLECSGGTLEDYISGSAVEKRYSKKPYEIEDAEVWHEIAKFLAIGLHNIIVTWSPNIVVLGGSMIVKAVGISVSHVKEHIEEHMHVFPTLPDIVQAELGDFGGLHGGLAYLRQHHNNEV